jgi:hypothetical protein
MQQTEIVVGVVKNDFDGSILEQCAQRPQWPRGQGIDDGTTLRRRKLRPEVGAGGEEDGDTVNGI